MSERELKAKVPLRSLLRLEVQVEPDAELKGDEAHLVYDPKNGEPEILVARLEDFGQIIRDWLAREAAE